jgi:hypothetical protein
LLRIGHSKQSLSFVHVAGQPAPPEQTFNTPPTDEHFCRSGVQFLQSLSELQLNGHTLVGCPQYLAVIPGIDKQAVRPKLHLLQSASAVHDAGHCPTGWPQTFVVVPGIATHDARPGPQDAQSLSALHVAGHCGVVEGEHTKGPAADGKHFGLPEHRVQSASVKHALGQLLTALHARAPAALLWQKMRPLGHFEQSASP